MNSNSKSTEPRKDWHPADIKAALAKKGWTFARIARQYGYVRNSPNTVLHKPWSQIEKIIGVVLGVKPSEIWPSRYDGRGRPLKKRASKFTSKVGRLAENKAVSNA